jgi:hypothetical protein
MSAAPVIPLARPDPAPPFTEPPRPALALVPPIPRQPVITELTGYLFDHVRNNNGAFTYLMAAVMPNSKIMDTFVGGFVQTAAKDVLELLKKTPLSSNNRPSGVEIEEAVLNVHTRVWRELDTRQMCNENI